MPSAPMMARIIPPVLAAALALGGCAPALHAAGAAQNFGPREGASRRPRRQVPGQPAAAGSVRRKTAVDPDSLPAGLAVPEPCQRQGRSHRRGHRAHCGADRRFPVRARRRAGPGLPSGGSATTSSSAAEAAPGLWPATAPAATTSTRLENGDWRLPYGAPPLVVIEGGGNDAARGASNVDIAEHAERLIQAIEDRYPAAEVVMVGTLARGAQAGGGRRTQVDSLLGAVAKEYGLSFVSVGDWLTRYGLAEYLADDRHLDADGHEARGGRAGASGSRPSACRDCTGPAASDVSHNQKHRPTQGTRQQSEPAPTHRVDAGSLRCAAVLQCRRGSRCARPLPPRAEA